MNLNRQIKSNKSKNSLKKEHVMQINMQTATHGILQATERDLTSPSVSTPARGVHPRHVREVEGGTQKSGLGRDRGATTHSHRPPDWIWALAGVRPSHQTSDCALASLAGCLGASAGRRGAGAPQDMAATSLHNARRQIWTRCWVCSSDGG